MLVRDNKKQKEYNYKRIEFQHDFNKELYETFEKFCVNEMKYFDWGNHHSPDWNEQKYIDAYDKEAWKKFNENFKCNWNYYSEQWTSPRGIEPMWEIVEL